MTNVRKLQTTETTKRAPPKRITRPCDYGLYNAIRECETQVGSVEAYNKLCDAAEAMKRKIDAGRGKQALEFFSTDPAFIYPLGHNAELSGGCKPSA